jgi:hypothetical protein
MSQGHSVEPFHYDGYDLGADEWWPLMTIKSATPNTAEPGDVVTYAFILTNATQPRAFHFHHLDQPSPCRSLPLKLVEP